MRKISRILRFVVIGLAAITLVGFVVMYLWNWLAPELFGWHIISFWQALGVLALSRVLFGGFRGRHGPPTHWRGRMIQRWSQMTPEEREEFRKSARSQCGPWSMWGPGTQPEQKVE